MTDEELNAPSYLIVKRGYYYRPNEQGYTSSAIQAGRYTLTEAEKITHPNGVDGPRDGMTFIHEDEVNDEDWKAYATLRAQLAAQPDDVAELPPSIVVRDAVRTEGHIAIRNLDQGDNDLGICIVPREHIDGLIAALARVKGESK